jgi:4-hydroxybenzoate-CoA ligase
MTFVGEWTRTGDKYHRRADGVYTYRGRSDDMFKVSGIWVSPFEIEEALTSHAKVAEAAVIPAEDIDGLIKPKAFIVLASQEYEEISVLFEELKEHVKRSIGPWKYPRWIRVVDELPKTSSGKLQRYMLREMVLDHNGPV